MRRLGIALLCAAPVACATQPVQRTGTSQAARPDDAAQYPSAHSELAAPLPPQYRP